jgi:hypothetical protein
VVTEPLTSTATLVAALLSRTLPKPAWTHVAHLRVGLWHVRRFGEAGALTALRERISAYNEAVGTANTESSGYHETLTVFYVRLIADFLARAGAAADGADEELEARLIADYGARELPLEYYSRDRLFSVEARRRWVTPDLKLLPETGDQVTR